MLEVASQLTEQKYGEQGGRFFFVFLFTFTSFIHFIHSFIHSSLTSFIYFIHSLAVGEEKKTSHVVQTAVLWRLLLNCELLVKDAMEMNNQMDVQLALLTQFVINIAARFRLQIEVHQQHWVGTRAHGALVRLVFSFVLTTLKARLRKPGMFPRLESLAMFLDFMQQFAFEVEDQPDASLFNSIRNLLQLQTVCAADAAKALVAIKKMGTTHALRGSGMGCKKERLLLCDWKACLNMEGPSELQLVTLASCEGSKRYCSRACQVAAWRESRKKESDAVFIKKSPGKSVVLHADLLNSMLIFCCPIYFALQTTTNGSVYVAFLDVLRTLASGQRNILEVYAEVRCWHTQKKFKKP